MYTAASAICLTLWGGVVGYIVPHFEEDMAISSYLYYVIISKRYHNILMISKYHNDIIISWGIVGLNFFQFEKRYLAEESFFLGDKRKCLIWGRSYPPSLFRLEGEKKIPDVRYLETSKRSRERSKRFLEKGQQ